MMNATDTDEEEISLSKAASFITEKLRPVDNGDDASNYNYLEYSSRNLAHGHANDDGDGPKPPKIDFLKDDPKEMTRSRRIALKLMKYRWYHPAIANKENAIAVEENSASNVVVEEEGDGSTRKIVEDFDKDAAAFEEPSLEKGWAFFEHQTLYRHLVPEGNKYKPKKNVLTRIFRTLFLHRNKRFHKTEPGEDENPSQLYPLFMPHNQLGDFGIGIGLYFSTLRILIAITLCCGLISIGNILYFASDEYDNNSDYSEAGFFGHLFLAGSAVCSSKEWVPCPTCDCKEIGRNHYGSLPYDRCAVYNYNATDSDGSVVEQTLIFALKNNCDGTKMHLAATNFATIAFTMISVLLLGWYMRREEVQFDEDEQTAQDYSVQIKNPPGDAKDPEEWRKFFKDNFDGARVTVCTCAVENDILIRVLAERRERIRKIASMQPGKSLDILELGKVAAKLERERNSFQRLLAMILPGIPEHYDRLTTLRGKVEGLAQLEYPVTNVFVTFETENDQRRVLAKLSVGDKNVKSNDASALSDPGHLFRGELVLDVFEPDEPSTIRWKDLNASLSSRLIRQVATFSFTLLLLALVCYIIYLIRQDLGFVFASYSISLFNNVFPEIAKQLVDVFEVHPSESQKQVSLYLKLVLFRWVATTVILLVIIPFTDTTLDDPKRGMIPAIYCLFFAEITLKSTIQLADPSGLLRRHVLAPRAKTQDAMNKLFEGSPYDLAELYSDMTKMLLLCLFYCSIFPASFFLCAISLIVKYKFDQFQLLRSFKRAPALGSCISKVSRRYYFIAVVTMAIVSSYYWTGFPFDNICPDQSLEEFDDDGNAASFGNIFNSSSEYIGTYTVSPYPKETLDVLEDRIFDEDTRETTIFDEAIATVLDGDKNIFDEEIANVTVTPFDSTYAYCNMDFLSVSPYTSFPFVPSSGNEHLDPQAYMTEQQIISTTYFGWSAFAVVIIILLKYCWSWYALFNKYYHGGYTAVGDSQGIPFSEVASRSAYIPQVQSDMFPFPLIACRVDGLCEELFDFTDPDRSFKYYDLTIDAKRLLAANHITNPPGFSIVKHWAPDKDPTDTPVIS